MSVSRAPFISFFARGIISFYKVKSFHCHGFTLQVYQTKLAAEFLPRMKIANDAMIDSIR